MEKQIEVVLRGGKFKKMLTNQLAGIKEKYGLKRVEIEILYFLTRCGEHNTSKDVCQYLNMNKGHISQAVESLCEQGYLTAITDTDDRRYIHYTVTEKAKAFGEEMATLWANIIQRLFEGIPEEELKVFEEVSGKIGENMNRIINE